MVLGLLAKNLEFKHICVRGSHVTWGWLLLLRSGTGNNSRFSGNSLLLILRGNLLNTQLDFTLDAGVEGQAWAMDP